MVTQNQGKRTSGIDGELWYTASERMQATLRTNRQTIPCTTITPYLHPRTLERTPNVPSPYQPCMTEQCKRSTLWHFSQLPRQLLTLDLSDFDFSDAHRMRQNTYSSVSEIKDPLNGYWKETSGDVLIISPMSGSGGTFQWISRYWLNS